MYLLSLDLVHSVPLAKEFERRDGAHREKEPMGLSGLDT